MGYLLFCILLCDLAHSIPNQGKDIWIYHMNFKIGIVGTEDEQLLRLLRWGCDFD